jgi:hypothetical protein
MGPPAWLIDSNVLIDHLEGVEAAGEFIRVEGESSVISVITVAELAAGAARRPSALQSALLDRFPVLSIDRTVAELAGTFRTDHRMKLPDAFQAALATVHRLKLVTCNVGDFPPARFRFVHVPYRSGG